MKQHLWLLEVVNDLEEYAQLVGLGAVSSQLGRLHEIIAEEVRATAADQESSPQGEPSVVPFRSA